MKAFKGNGFEIDSTGSLKRTLDFDNPGAQHVRSFKAAAASVGQFLGGLRDTIATENRALDPDERVALAHAQNFQGDVKRALAKAEELAEAERNWRPGQPDPDVQAAADARARAGIHDDRPAPGQFVGNGGSARSHRWNDVFGAHTRSTDGWASMGEFFAQLHSGLPDHRIRAAYALAGGSGAAFIPTEYAAQLADTPVEDDIVRPRCQVWGMTSDKRWIPGLDLLNATGGAIGGFSIQWIDAGDEIALQTVKTRAIELQARKAAALTEIPNELLMDGLGFEAALTRIIPKAISHGIDTACFTGTGAGQPLGIFNSPVLITVAKEVGQAGSTILYANLTKMQARLHPALFAQSIWVASTTTIPQLSQLTIPIGTGGAHIPVMSQDGDGTFRILTRPVVFTEKVPALGAKGDVSLCAWSEFALGIRMELALEKSAHVGFTRDTSHYRLLMRLDGQPTWNSVYTPVTGDTLSPFVTLEART